jgi:hypothetical protein
VKAWKQFEADAAAIFNGKRFWANSGERLDFEGVVSVRDTDCPPGVPTTRKARTVRGQCKLVKRLPLEKLTQLAEESGVDVVCVKVRRGAGRPSPMLIVFTAEKYKALHG